MTTVALVTGAASGMGQLAARRLAAAGTRVAAVDRDEEGLAVTALRSPNMATFVCDVTDPDAIQDVVTSVVDDLGPVDQLIHAAGICRIGAALDQPLTEFSKVFDVNLFGTVNVTRAVVPVMVRRGSGSVVLFGSLAGWLPSPKLAAYCASKFAVTAYAEVLFEELHATGVRITCICPSEVDTPLARDVREIDSSVLGNNRPTSPETVVDRVEAVLAQPNPPLFVFPGIAAPVVKVRRWLPELLRSQLLRHVAVPTPPS